MWLKAGTKWIWQGKRLRRVFVLEPFAMPWITISPQMGVILLTFFILDLIESSEQHFSWNFTRTVSQKLCLDCAGMCQTHIPCFQEKNIPSSISTHFEFILHTPGPYLEQKTQKYDLRKNLVFLDKAKMLPRELWVLTRDYEGLRGIRGCQATPVRWSLLGRKTEGRDTKSSPFWTGVWAKGW